MFCLVRTLNLRFIHRLFLLSPIDGAAEKIVSLRSRYEQLNSSIARYESKVSRQMAQLARINRHKDGDVDDDDDDTEALEDEDVVATEGQVETNVTEEDIRRENDEIRELEKKKQQLEERVKEMERDLGGLRR